MTDSYGDTLSDDNILGILSWLPFSSLVRAGAVSRRWRRLSLVTKSRHNPSWCLLSVPVRNPSFKEVYVSDCGASSMRRLPRNSNGSFHIRMFDPFTRKWFNVANSFSLRDSDSVASSSRELLLVPSTGGYSGLVCVAEWEEESSNSDNVYHVGNPVTNKWKAIVGPSPWRGVHQLVVNPITKAYKIITIRWERRDTAYGTRGVWRVAIYDSEKGAWRKGNYFSVNSPPSGVPYSLSSRTHTASEKMMYLVMHRAGKQPNWETYTEIQIVGYDIENDKFRFITPVSRFDHCLEYFEPTSCEDWPLHLVLKSDQCRAAARAELGDGTGEGEEEGFDYADASCLQLVTCTTAAIPRKWPFQARSAATWRVLLNKIRGYGRYQSGFVNKMCIFEFNTSSGSWEVKEKNSSLQVHGKFYSKKRIFHCAGDKVGHLYYAHIDDDQSVVVYNPKKHDLSSWSRLPLLDNQCGGCMGKNYHSLGSFIPRLDATP